MTITKLLVDTLKLEIFQYGQGMAMGDQGAADRARVTIMGIFDDLLAESLETQGGETREEWGVWWHADSAEGIVLDEYQLRSRDEAQRVGESRIGDYGIRGFTLVCRTHTHYETGDWSTKWERIGEPWWRPVENETTP